MKPWLLTAQLNGPRVIVGDFDHQFEAWVARKSVLQERPRCQAMVEGNPEHFGTLLKRADPVRLPGPVSHWHEAVRRENDFHHYP